MNKNFRLTVHVANQPKVDTRAPLAVSKKVDINCIIHYHSIVSQ